MIKRDILYIHANFLSAKDTDDIVYTLRVAHFHLSCPVEMASDLLFLAVCVFFFVC